MPCFPKIKRKNTVGIPSANRGARKVRREGTFQVPQRGFRGAFEKLEDDKIRRAPAREDLEIIDAASSPLWLTPSLVTADYDVYPRQKMSLAVVPRLSLLSTS